MRPDPCLRNAGRRYGPHGPWVLRAADLTLAPGRLVRVEGANGSGKSTLLRLLAGIDAPGSWKGVVPLPLPPLAAAALVTAGTLALAGAPASRRSP
ncbi:ATP-binding cassette domain-containing protein [Streptomyces sp. NPDC092370]|uniref:ATP-binding cassette domain-containing protein n=1 Tax=Streptomyces sp. NPDC092370 TaxID=3366016 RepID=UPI0038256099